MGIFRPTHIRQFILFDASICFLLFLFRRLKFSTFLIIFGCCLIAIGIVTYIEKKCTVKTEPFLLDDISHQTTTNAKEDNIDLYEFDPVEFAGDNPRCEICMKPFIEGEDIAFLPCLHGFHPDCIRRWMTVQKSCPICRSNF